jgi:glycosyltransferase involved in cell wall biosynthesis
VTIINGLIFSQPISGKFTVSNEAFQKFLQRFIDDRLENANTFVQFIPSLVSRFGYEEMPPLIRNNSEKLRIGLIKPSEEDLLSLKEVLLKTNSSFKKKIQFVCLGKPHSSKEVDLLIKEVDCELHDSVSFLDYFEKLNNLQLDLVLLPAKEGLYNRHKNSQLFLEFSVFGIPVITSIHHTAKLLLKEGETGLLASEAPEWIENIGLLIKDAKSKERLGRNALKWSWRFQSYNVKNVELLTQTFI